MIWHEVFATGLVAAMGAGLAVPSARRLMLGDLKQDWLQDQLELDRVESDRATIRGKDGSLSQVYRFIGTSYDAKVEAEQTNLLDARTQLLNKLGQLGLSQRWFGVKRKRPINAAAEWPNAPLQAVGDAEAELFKASYFIDWYVVLTASAMPPLLEAAEKIEAGTGKYGVSRVRAAKKGRTCELTGFLNGLVSGDYRKDLPAIISDISGGLPASDISCEKATGLIRTFTPTERLQRIFTVARWPGVVSGQLINELMGLEGELEVCQICEPVDQLRATAYLARRASGEDNALMGNPEAAAELQSMMQMVNKGDTTLFVTQFVVTAYAENQTDLDRLTKRISRCFSNRQIMYNVQVRGAPVCWFSRVPGKPRGKVLPGGQFMSPLELRTQNIAAMWALPHAATGLAESPLGPGPLRWLRTISGQAYAANFHVVNKEKSLANFLVFAPAGGGKSTLLMHMLSGAAKFSDVRSFIFDSKEGSRFMTEALGGLYQNYDGLSLNPLDVGEDTPANRERLRFVMGAMAGIELSGDDKDAIDHAIGLAMQLEPPERTFNNVFPYAFPKRGALRRAFQQWVVDEKGNRGLRSHIMNAPHDSLGGMFDQSHMVGINMSEALADPSLGAPIVAHMAETIYRSVAPNLRGFLLLIEEAAKLCQNAGFLSLAKEMYREYRKLGGVVGMVFQDPAALMETGAAPAFIENTGTFIFFPNSKVDDKSLLPFNLNEEQRDFIKGKARSEDFDDRRVLIVKRDEASGFEESAILNVDLTPLGDPLKFYRSGSDENRLMERLQREWGEQWRDHL